MNQNKLKILKNKKLFNDKLELLNKASKKSNK